MQKKKKKRIVYKQLKISGDCRYLPDEEQEEQEEQGEQEEQKEQKEQSKESKYFKYIENGSKDISYIWFNHFFNFVKPSDLAKNLFEIKDKKENNDFVEEIKNRWSKLKDKIEDMYKDEKKNKGLDKILEIVKDILSFNKQNQE